MICWKLTITRNYSTTRITGTYTASLEAMARFISVHTCKDYNWYAKQLLNWMVQTLLEALFLDGGNKNITNKDRLAGPCAWTHTKMNYVLSY